MAWWSKALDYISAPLSQPKTFLTKGWSAAAKAVKTTRKDISIGKKSGWKTIGTTLTSTAVVAGAVLAAAPASSTGLYGASARKAALMAAKRAKKLIPKTIKGKVLGSVVAAVGVGKVIKSPAKAAGTLIEAPAEIAEFGGDLVAFGYNPSVKSAKNILKGSPILSAAVAGTAVLAAAPIVIPTATAVIRNDKLKDIEKAIATAPTSVAVVAPQNQLINEKAVGIPAAPQQPQTTNISKPKRRYKRRTAKKAPQVRNNIKVNIVNAPKVTGLSMKRYIKNELLN